MANDNVVTNPASIPAAATVPRKIPPAESLGRRAWRVGRESKGKKNFKLIRCTQVASTT